MIKTKGTALFIAAATLFASLTSGCATDDIGAGDENVEEGDDLLGHGELLPGPDYTIQNDPTYDFIVASEGGPETDQDYQALDEFEAGLDQAARDTWVQLPGWIQSEFPGLTESERNALISDFQDSVAVGQMLRDIPNSANCLEMYIEDPNTHQITWTPVCDDNVGPTFENRFGKIARWVVAKATAGRQAIGKAANYVGNVVTKAAGQAQVVAGQALQKARTIAGQVAQQVKAGAVVAGQKALQVATWAREQARGGWTFVKMKWKEAIFGGVVGGFAGQPGADLYNYLKASLFGKPTETSTTTTNAAALLGDEHGNPNFDALFDM